VQLCLGFGHLTRSQICHWGFNLGITSVALNENMFRQCFVWMRANRVTFYDASYLVVAYELQGTLITADKRFLGKMGKVDHVCLLRELDI
jgi:predicted nucleic acid-binding protein